MSEVNHMHEGDPMLSSIQCVIETLQGEGTTGPERSYEQNFGIPMSERRPSWLRAAIDAEYSDLPNLSKKYKAHGFETDYMFGETPATEIIRQYRERVHLGGPLRILDIGTGAGRFVTGNEWVGQDVVHGVSGQDYRCVDEYRLLAPGADDPRYIVGNAEYLSELPGLEQRYDVVVSKLTYQHFVDEIGTLEQIVDRVARGGLLCLDLGYTNRSLAVQLLRQHGFESVAAPGVNDIDDFACTDIVMHRTGSPDPARFNVGYKEATPEVLAHYQASLERPLTPFELHRMVWGYETSE